MVKLPDKYQWLLKEKAPKMIVEALKLYGVKESVGSVNNPLILSWATECKLPQYNADSIPWCGLFVAVVALRSEKHLSKNPLWARSWAAWGTPSPAPSLGDVLVFSRAGGGHVGIYVGEDKLYYHVLGGNQGDSVSITRISKDRLIAARRSYKIGPPPNVRPVYMDEDGEISLDEA